jgi:hypothetical protein
MQGCQQREQPNGAVGGVRKVDRCGHTALTELHGHSFRSASDTGTRWMLCSPGRQRASSCVRRSHESGSRILMRFSESARLLASWAIVDPYSRAGWRAAETSGSNTRIRDRNSVKLRIPSPPSLSDNFGRVASPVV